MKKIRESELIINPDGSIYHLKLKPEHIANKIIIVGDPDRVELVSNHFDKIEYKIQNREFITHTGLLNNVKITVLATGIGTDNIDIVLNELDAIVNIDLKNRVVKDKLTSLNIIRLGTSGALQPDIPVDSFMMSEYGMGFDGLMNFYCDDHHTFEDKISDAFIKHSGWSEKLAYPYVVKGSEYLINTIGAGLRKGITATAPGFYGPQGRELRLHSAMPELFSRHIESFDYEGKRITNFEMETSALYGLGRLLGHNTLTVCAIIANRINRQYSKDHHHTIDKLIRLILEKITLLSKYDCYSG